MVIMSPNRMIGVGDLCADLRLGRPSTTAGGPSVGDVDPAVASDGHLGFDPAGMSLQDARREFEKAMITNALERHHWNVSRAAEELQLERTNLHKKMKSLGLERSAG